MNNENANNNVNNNDTLLDKCNHDIMGNREDNTKLLDDDENDNRSLESQMSTRSNHQSSLDSVERRQSKDNPHHDQQQEQQGNTNDDDDVDTPFKDGSSEDEVEPTDVTFSGILFDDKKLSWHLEQALGIILRLGSAVLGDQYDDLHEHLKQVEENRISSIASVQGYFELELYQEEIKQCQDAASGGLSDYISSLEGEDSNSEPPSFDKDDESMLSSGSKGESDQDESFPSSSKKRVRGDDDEEEDGDPPPRPKQRSRSSKAASDDESQDESQMHEKDLDDDDEQSQSKASKQQEKEAKDKEKAEQQEKQEDAKYDAMPEVWKQVKNASSSSDKDIMAVVTNANDKLSDVIGALFDPSNPNRIDNLQSILRRYVIVLNPSIRANSMLLSRSKAKADGLASVVSLGGDASLSKFLLCCDSDNNEVNDEDPEITAQWELITAAIRSIGTKLSVEQFLVLGSETRNMLMHLLHSQALQFIFSEITLSGLTAHLSAKASAALTSAMKELAQLVDPDAPFSLSMVVSSFMKQYALPGLAMDSVRGKAIDVVIDIFGSLTCSSGRMSKDQKKAYKENILSPFERVDASTISGGRVEGHVSKYFCDNRVTCDKKKQVYKDRRRRVVCLGLALYLKDAIEDLLDMHDSGQYTRGILRLSASDIMKKVSPLMTKALFKKNGGESQIKAVEKMKKLVLKKKSTARTLLIESDEQVDCLMHLINLLRTFSNESNDR